MQKKNIDSTVNVIIFTIGMISMLCLLLYSWKHTGDLFARHIAPMQIGYICALGIELSVVWLSWKLGKTHTLKSMSGVALMMVVVVSAAANLSEGFYVRYETEMTLSSFASIDWIQFGISVMATLLISIIVFALSEVLSGDSKKALSTFAEVPHVVHKDSIAAISQTCPPVAVNAITETKINETKRKQTDKPTALKEYILQNPNATYRDITANTPITNIAAIKPLAQQIGYTKTPSGWMHTNGATK